MPPDWDNVVLLSADALRADHLSCYGYERETSPVLDDLASESLVFEHAYSASSHTREAVPALLTGQYPDVAVDDGYHLASESIAERLSDAGYATGGFHSNPFVSRAYGFDRGFDEFDDDLHLGQHKLVALAQRALDKLRNRHYARAEEINERALAWVDSLGEEPLFLWNHYMDTHGPYEPPGEYRALYADRQVSDREAQSLYQRAIDDPESITDDERQLLIDLYDAEIRYNDAQIGAFLDALRERELFEESLLIITADHGDAFGEHGYYEHPRHLHDELVHVPLLVRLPDGASGTVETPASTLDVAATVADAAGLDAGDVAGTSLLNPPTDDRTVFQQARGEDEFAHVTRYAARSRQDHALCERDRETDAVRVDDYTTRTIRIALETHVEDRTRSAHGDPAAGTDESDESVDDEIERRLEALGYTD